MTEQTKSIIEKVQKLLSLQKGAEVIGSLKEAANAAEKVQTLLLKYNLEMADISAYDPDREQKIGRAIYRDVYAKKNEGKWIYRLYDVLAKHNLCDVIFSRFRDTNNKFNMYVNLIGTKDNVIVVKFLADQLDNRLRRLEIKAWDSEGKYYGEKRNAFRRAYLMGACHGIDIQLKEAKVRAMGESKQINALVLANDIKLYDAVTHFFPNLKNGRARTILSAQVGESLGYRDGRSMAINKGIGSKGNGTAALN